jgi:hypothetical protein
MDKKKEVIDRHLGNGQWIYPARLIWFNMHKVSLSPSGNVLGLLAHAGYLGEDFYDHDITFVDAKSEKNINAMPRYCADGRPLAIHFNLQGTKVVVHTEKECFVHSLDKEVRKLSMIKDVSYIKMLILQKFFDQ